LVQEKRRTNKRKRGRTMKKEIELGMCYTAQNHISKKRFEEIVFYLKMVWAEKQGFGCYYGVGWTYIPKRYHKKIGTLNIFDVKITENDRKKLEIPDDVFEEQFYISIFEWYVKNKLEAEE